MRTGSRTASSKEPKHRFWEQLAAAIDFEGFFGEETLAGVVVSRQFGKWTMQMDRFKAKSTEIVSKEFYAGSMASNSVRGWMALAPDQSGGAGQGIGAMCSVR